MSDGVKQVAISLTPEDIKAISRSKTRKRKGEEGEDYIPVRRRKSSTRGGGEEVDLTIEHSATPEVPTSPPETPPATPSPAPLSTSVQSPTSTAPVQGGKVKIQTRKRTHTATAEMKPLHTAKILPIKRFAPVASKPKLVIPNKSSPTSSESAKELKPIKESKPIKEIKESKDPKKKRRFTERRLSISIDHVVKTRKHRKHVKVDVDTMSLEDIRTDLVKRGILRKHAKVPDSMLRSMMKDVLLLNTPE